MILTFFVTKIHDSASTPQTRYYKKSSLAGGQNGESNLASPKCAFHLLTTLPQCLHNLIKLKSHESKKNKQKRWRLVCDKQHQLTYIPAGVTAKFKHIGGVFVALVPCCPVITIGILVIAIVIFNVLQYCGDRKGYISV